MKSAHEYENQTEMGLDHFLEQMKLKLALNQEKKGDSWQSCDIQFLELKLYEELDEFYGAKTPMEKAKELVDVANVCMMLNNRYLEQWAEKAGELMFGR